MRSKISGILALAIVVVVAGCAAQMGAPRMEEQARNKVLNYEPTAEESGLYILRTHDGKQSGFHRGLERSVYVNGRYLTTLSGGEATFVRIVPGEHVISTSMDNRTINVEPNTLRYVIVDSYDKSAWWLPSDPDMRIAAVSDSKGKAMVRRASFVMAKKRKITSTAAE